MFARDTVAVPRPQQTDRGCVSQLDEQRSAFRVIFRKSAERCALLLSPSRSDAIL